MVTYLIRDELAHQFTKEFNLEHREIVVLRYSLKSKVARYSIDYETFQKIDYDKIKHYIPSNKFVNNNE